MNCIDCIYCDERHNGLWCDFMNNWLSDTTPCFSYNEYEEDE